MRLRPIAAAAMLALSGAALTACTAAPESVDGCMPAFLPGQGASQVELSGEFGGAVSAEFDGPLPADEPSVVFAEAGEGKRAGVGDSAIAHVTVQDGTTGEVVFSSQQGGAPFGLSVGSAEDGRALESAALCAAPGSRIVAVTTVLDALGEGSSFAGSQLAPTDAVVITYDVMDVFAGRAEGLPQPAHPELPGVTVTELGQPGLTFKNNTPPEELTVAQTIKGNGETVAAGDSILVQYTGVNWDTREVFDSSWNTAKPNAAPDAAGSQPVVFPMQQGQVIDGFYNGLVGQPVGSQVIISVPPEQGYGNSPNMPPMIGPEDTLVFVVDILGKV
ncbi:FKBP-type peptidyl-prolyl cis-trans isomerase [Agrococcus casei]|uniref:FKBP-type peptidyl-prolyl cis-trans isomerase n=1 Tax=Agrococcus casei TaxID=343512 RepID=UPI003F9248B7